MIRLTALALALALSGCSGQAKPLNVLLQPTDSVVSAAGYDSQIQPIIESDPVKSVSRQAALGGNVILWIGGKSQQTIDNFPALIAESRKYNNFTHVYLYDELFWTPNGIEIGKDEAIVLQGAAIAHQAGLQTIVTILPDVILDPRFKLASINAFDVISIDVYPSIRPTKPDLNGCAFSANHLENLMYCSAMKLRQMGFAGQVGYIFQGFGLHSEPDAVLTANLALQRSAINNASALGASAVMSWGRYLSPSYIANEPDLFQLAGTKHEPLVTP